MVRNGEHTQTKSNGAQQLAMMLGRIAGLPRIIIKDLANMLTTSVKKNRKISLSFRTEIKRIQKTRIFIL